MQITSQTTGFFYFIMCSLAGFWFSFQGTGTSELKSAHCLVIVLMLTTELDLHIHMDFIGNKFIIKKFI